MELLILLASRDGQLVTREEIAKRLWESDVFVDTEHGINTAVRKIRTVLRDDTEDPRFIQTVTGVGYRFVASVVARPAAVQVELAPAPAKEIAATVDGPAPPVATHRPSHRALWLISGSAVAALVLLAPALGPHSVLARMMHRDAPIASLAVLPLDNLSGDPSQNYFADGTTDELTTMLARNSTLRVVSRTSAMQYKGVHRPLSEIGHALGVDAIVEGSVSRSSGGVHMTVQLIRADTDTHLWAQSYDRSPDEVPTLPDDAARDIAAFLHRSVATPPTIRYVNPEAHDAYLHGYYLWLAGRNQDAEAYFEKAVQIQPDYALGWAGISDYYGAGAVDALLDPRSALPTAFAAASRAVALDNTLAQAHLALCATIFLAQWDPVHADQECRTAIQLDPEFAEPYHFRAKIFASLNRHAEAIEQQKKATEIDPFGRPFALAYSYQLARRYDAGITDAQQRLSASPGDESLHWILSVLYRCKGMKKESIAEEEKMAEATGDSAFAQGLRKAFDAGGYDATLRWQIAELERNSRTTYVSPMSLAILYAQLGNREKTLALLEQALEQRTPDLLWVQCDPAYDFLHADPRYRSLVQQVGLPPAY